MAKQHVVLSISIEVSDSRDAVVEVERKFTGALLIRDEVLAVHGVVVPSTIGMAEHQVVLSIAVEISDARHR